MKHLSSTAWTIIKIKMYKHWLHVHFVQSTGPGGKWRQENGEANMLMIIPQGSITFNNKS